MRIWTVILSLLRLILALSTRWTLYNLTILLYLVLLLSLLCWVGSILCHIHYDTLLLAISRLFKMYCYWVRKRPRWKSLSREKSRLGEHYRAGANLKNSSFFLKIILRFLAPLPSSFPIITATLIPRFSVSESTPGLGSLFCSGFVSITWLLQLEVEIQHKVAIHLS